MTDDRDGPPPRKEDIDAMDLEAALRELIGRVDAVPPEVERYAVAAFAFRTAGEDFAELEWDSWTDAEALVRGPAEARMLIFGPGGPDGPRGTRVHLGVTRTPSGFELDGYLEPAGHTEAEVHYHGGVRRRPIDGTGRFDADLPAVRSIRLRLSGGAATPTVTGWVALG